jgi:dephospho-CoA kinase
MLLVGLTGNIAAGKSTVAGAFADRGATIIDSDLAARDAVAPGTPALAAIVEHFGAGMLSADGTLDRTAMSTLVFRDAEARHALERLVHPAVEATRRVAVADAAAHGAAIVICDVPLLFEVRLAWQFARIVLVDAPAAVRIARLERHRRLNMQDAALRVSAQMPASLKRGRSDIVIENRGSRTALDAQIAGAWHRLTAWAAVAEPDRSA